MMQPNSRHSIDLGASPRNHILPHPYHPVPAVMNSPRWVNDVLDWMFIVSRNSQHVIINISYKCQIIHVRISFYPPAQINRSRLSLDLGSPTTSVTKSLFKSTTPVSAVTPTSLKSPSVTKVSTPTSPLVANSAPFPSRYTEFKTYSSTFDGLQALESHINNNTNSCNNNNSVISINGHRVSSITSTQQSSSPENPLMRVSSLPTINPQNQLAGNYFILLVENLVFVPRNPFSFHYVSHSHDKFKFSFSERTKHEMSMFTWTWNGKMEQSPRGYSCRFLTSSLSSIYVPFVVDKLEHHGVVSRSRFQRSPFLFIIIIFSHVHIYPMWDLMCLCCEVLFIYVRPDVDTQAPKELRKSWKFMP